MLKKICQCRRHKRPTFDSWVRKIPWRRAWQPTPVFLPGEFHGQRSLAGYGPWVTKSQTQLKQLRNLFGGVHSDMSPVAHKESSKGDVTRRIRNLSVSKGLVDLISHHSKRERELLMGSV